MPITLFELLLLIALLEGVVIIVFIFWGGSKLIALTEKVSEQKILISVLAKDVAILKVADTRLLSITKANADTGACNQQQIEQIQDYFTRVLGISNLIGCAEQDIEPNDLIEEFRARIKWAREVERLQNNNPDEYYKGD